MALEYVSLTLDLYDGKGAPLSTGTAVLTPSAQLTDSVEHEIVTMAPVTVNFAGGTPIVSLLATDNANMLPSGWAWTISFNGVAGNPPGFGFMLQFGDGTDQFLSAQAPVQPTTEMAGFLRGTYPGDDTEFLNGQGEWTVPAGSGGGGSGTVLPFTTQYDLVMADADGTTPVRLPLGADGTFVGNSGGVLGYFTPPTSGGGMVNPMTSKGDVIYSSDGSGTPTRLAVGASGTFIGSSAGVPAWLTPGSTQFVVVLPSGDTSGVTDTKAIVNAINTLTTGGVVYLAPGVFYVTYVAGWSNAISHGGYSGMTGKAIIVPQQTTTGVTGAGPVSIQGSGLGATIVKVVSNAAGMVGVYAHRTSGYGAQFGNPMQQQGGFLRDFTIDGTLATHSGVIGLDFGDAWGADCDLAVGNFDGTGQIGVTHQTHVFWCEKQRLRLQLINNQTAMYASTDMPNGDWSHEYNDYDIYMFSNQNQQGLVFDGVNMGGSILRLHGNMCQTTATSGAPTNNVAAISLINAVGATNTTAHRWYLGQIWMKIEGNQTTQFPTGSVFPYGIYSDGVGKIQQCGGFISHSVSDSKMNGAQFLFYGPVVGDPNLTPTAYV